MEGEKSAPQPDHDQSCSEGDEHSEADTANDSSSWSGESGQTEDADVFLAEAVAGADTTDDRTKQKRTEQYVIKYVHPVVRDEAEDLDLSMAWTVNISHHHHHEDSKRDILLLEQVIYEVDRSIGAGRRFLSRAERVGDGGDDFRVLLNRTTAPGDHPEKFLHDWWRMWRHEEAGASAAHLSAAAKMVREATGFRGDCCGREPPSASPSRSTPREPRPRPDGWQEVDVDWSSTAEEEVKRSRGQDGDELLESLGNMEI